jgi:predicted nucleic acid-binding protein
VHIISVDARILAEYEEVLDRPKFKFEKDKVATFLDHIVNSGFMTASSPLSRSFPEIDDGPFLEVAIATQANCIVTGIQIHFPSELCHGIQVLAPYDFLAFYRQQLTSA